jgi:hypothetical protein
MSATSPTTFVIAGSLALLATLATAGCRAPDPLFVDAPSHVAGDAVAPAAAGTPIMRTYDAPQGRAEELANVLQRVLSGPPDMAPIGKARAMDGDRVLVVAPAGIHEGVASLCAQLGQRGGTPARSVQISYWLVHAKPAEHTDASAAPEIDPALQEIAAAVGPTAFTLFERATLSSMLNSEAKTSGVRAQFEQVATAHEGGIVADIDIELRTMAGSLETRISLQQGKTVVIGQNGVEGSDERLFYVLRAELVDAA